MPHLTKSAHERAEQIINPVYDRLNRSEERCFFDVLNRIDHFEGRAEALRKWAEEDKIDELLGSVEVYEDEAWKLLPEIESLAEAVTDENIRRQAADYRRDLALTE